MKNFWRITIAAFLFAGLGLTSCAKSNKTIIRMQHLEEGVSNPTSIDEIKDAIAKYENRVADIQLAQSQIGIWYKMLASRYSEKKMYGLALENYQKALEYYPQNQNIYYNIGLCAGYVAMTKLDFNGDGTPEEKANFLKLSETAYLQAIEIEPRFASALYGLGVLYCFNLSEPEKAIPYLERLLTIEKKHISGMFVLARAYYMDYQFDKAIAMYDTILATTKSADRKKEAQANKDFVMEVANGQ